jgi:hypothetical protein
MVNIQTVMPVKKFAKFTRDFSDVLQLSGAGRVAVGRGSGARELFQEILWLIAELRPQLPPAPA